MSKRTFLLISIALMLSPAGYALACNGVIPQATPIIDGVKENTWSISPGYPIANLCAGSAPDNDVDLSCSWWGLWDADYFYVFVDVNDDSLWNDSIASYEDDSVDFMIDIGNDKQEWYGEDDYNYRVSWNATGTREIEEYNHGLRSLIGVEYELVTKGGDIGYTIEIKFPWDTLDYLERGVALGDDMGFEVLVNDDDDGGARDTQLSWCDITGTAWNDPSVLGTVVLVPGSKACEPDPHDSETGVREGLLGWVAGIFAASHKVYFDTSETNVQNRSGCDVNGASSSGPSYTVSIAADTAYYWAIDEVNETGPDPCLWEGNVWSFMTAPLTASSPDPCDGDQLVDIDADLSWVAGFYENGHKVYFDTSETNVQNRSGCEVNGVSTTDPCYPLDWLETNTTYYWAIDEVNETGPDPCIWLGDVWEFKTQPVPGGSILREVWRNIPGDKVSDLTENVRYPDSPDERSEVPIFDDPTGGENYGTRMHGWLYVWNTDYYTFWIASDEQSELWLSTDDDPENAELIASVPEYTGPREWDKYPEQQSYPIPLQAGHLYYIMALHKEGYGQDHMAVAWSTTPDPCDAEVIDGRYYLAPYLQLVSFRPNPADRATDVQSAPVLSWSPGMYAAEHDIYFGTDRDAVRNASRSDDPWGVLVKTDLTSIIPTTTYDITNDPNVGLLEFDTTYYWRIDDVNMAIDPCFWKGRTWSFTTGRYHVVEDFERYANTTALKTVWSAKSDISATSDMVCEYHRGNQAMALKYNNSLSYSEAYADSNGANSLGFGFNWRLKNVKALALWLHGIVDLRGNQTGADPYTLESDGAGIDNTDYDTCYFFYKEIDSLYAIVEARVDSIENTDPSAMACAMMRDTLNANSIYAATVVTPDGRVIFMGRPNTGGNSLALATISGITMPHWVRITRYLPSTPPARIFAEHAVDVGGGPGPWVQVGNDMLWGIGTQPTYTGLCVTSNSYGEMCTTEISNVSMAKNTTFITPDGTDVGKPNADVDIGDYTYNDPEPMYVTLEDGWGSDWTEYYEDKDDTVTQTGEWTQWRLDLNDFIVQNVNLCDIRTMYIGVGDKEPPFSSGSGTVYIDDIRLYLAEFYEPECPPLQADLVRDGEVNYKDLKMITDNWLISDYDVTPVAPPTAPVSWYQLNNDACDTGTPGGHDGNEVGDPTYTVDCQEGDYAIDFDGAGDYVQTAFNAADYGIDGNKARTITAWAKARTFDDEFRGVYEIGGYDENGQDFSLLTSGDEPNVWRANHEGGPDSYDIDFAYPSLNEWVHFAHTYDGTTVRVYVDGYAIAEAERVLDLNTTNAKTFSIGRWTSWGWGAAGYFDGIVDDVRIYDYALSQENAAYIARYPDASEFTQPLELLLMPHNPDINLHDREDPNTIDFRDIAVLGEHWGETQVWP